MGGGIEKRKGKEMIGIAYEYSIAFMNFSGSPAVMCVSAMRREVTGRRPEGSGRSRNWSVHAIEVEELAVSGSLSLFSGFWNSGISPAPQTIATRMTTAPLPPKKEKIEKRGFAPSPLHRPFPHLSLPPH